MEDNDKLKIINSKNEKYIKDLKEMIELSINKIMKKKKIETILQVKLIHKNNEELKKDIEELKKDNISLKKDNETLKKILKYYKKIMKNNIKK